MFHGTPLAMTTFAGTDAKGGKYLMKIEISFLAALLLAGTDLLVRAAVQGVEQALFSTAVEHALNGLKATAKIFPISGRCPARWRLNQAAASGLL
jgi:hypothetical protein